MLINKREAVGLKQCNDSKAFVAYSNNMDDTHENIEGYNINKESKIFIIFSDIVSNKNRIPIITELFIRVKKLNISIVSIRQSYFAVPKKY